MNSNLEPAIRRRSSLRDFYALEDARTLGDVQAFLRGLYRIAQALARRSSPLAQAYLEGVRASIAQVEGLRASLLGLEARPSRQRPLVFGEEVGIARRPSLQAPAL